MLTWQALFEPEGDSVVVTFPDLGHGATFAANEAEAREMAADFLQTVITELIRRGEDIPTPRHHRGSRYRAIPLTALASVKAELYTAFRASGIRRADLARRLGISRGNVERLFDLRHSSRLEHLEAAAHAVGARLAVTLEAEAA
jgi:antitoxin HicB